MCGINGIFGLEKIDRPEETISKMNKTLAHRGPDADGIFLADKVVLGHQRLAIIDLDRRADQPMKSVDGRYTLVYNGELYNFKELKERLKNYPYKSECDTEVILAAFSEWGIKCLGFFNGMFAFAIWDEWEEQLFVVRDRVGIKPLYYFESGNAVIFSSELRALLSSGLIPRKLSGNGLVDYLRYATVHAPDTIIEGVKQLEAGHYLKITDQEIQKIKYFEFGHSEKTGSENRTTIKKNIRDLLSSSVEKRTVSDVGYGAFLSGGIDSSIVVGLMSEILPRKVNTFSIVFNEEEFSEAKYSRMVSKKFKTQHHEIKLGLNDLLEILPEALNSMDHPSGDGPNTYLVSKKTKENGITMALSGLGGDELFAGYDLFKHCANISQKKWITSFPVFIRKMAGSVYSNVKKSPSATKVKDLLVQDHFDLEYIYPTMRTVLSDERITELLDRSTLPQNSVFNIAKETVSFEGYGFKLPYLSKVSLLEFSTYMSNVLLRDSDQMAMANALEVRVPFLDHELVDYVLNISDQEKYPHSPKELLVETFRDLLPKEITDRPKMGFTFPWKDWMKNDLKQFCGSMLDSFKQRDSITEKAIEDLWSRFLNDDPTITWSRIWHLVVLEHWLLQNDIQE